MNANFISDFRPFRMYGNIYYIGSAKYSVHLIDTEAASLDDIKNLKIRINRAHQLAYNQAIRMHRDDIRSFCASRGVAFLTVRCDQPIEKVLFKELLKVGIMA